MSMFNIEEYFPKPKFHTPLFESEKTAPEPDLSYLFPKPVFPSFEYEAPKRTEMDFTHLLSKSEEVMPSLKYEVPKRPEMDFTHLLPKLQPEVPSFNYEPPTRTEPDFSHLFRKAEPFYPPISYEPPAPQKIDYTHLLPKPEPVLPKFEYMPPATPKIDHTHLAPKWEPERHLPMRELLPPPNPNRNLLVNFEHVGTVDRFGNVFDRMGFDSRYRADVLGRINDPMGNCIGVMDSIGNLQPPPAFNMPVFHGP